MEQFVADLRSGLVGRSQRELPSKYLYDEVGSALFEVICVLPEYGLTRADLRLLGRHAKAVVERLPADVMVAELGSGSSKKTRLLLEPLARRGATTFFPIDISASALSQCARELCDVGGLTVRPLHMEYLPGLQAVASQRPAGSALLVLFLGSTIGNFARHVGLAFLSSVREILRPGDSLLLSSDLIKDEATLVRAYDDHAGVTAAFNKNVLCRINRELAGNFDVSRFSHEARWNPHDRRIEMHLRAEADMEAIVGKAGLTVAIGRGETIKTEDSYKYERAEILALAAESGFRCVEQWTDAEWPFAQSLLVAT